MSALARSWKVERSIKLVSMNQGNSGGLELRENETVGAALRTANVR